MNDLHLQLGQVIENTWASMCRTTDDVRLLTEKYGMSVIDGMNNPTIDDMLGIAESLDKICSAVIDLIEKNSESKEYIDTRLLLNARQMYLHFYQMVLAYKANNIVDFLAARDLLKTQPHF